MEKQGRAFEAEGTARTQPKRPGGCSATGGWCDRAGKSVGSLVVGDQAGQAGCGPTGGWRAGPRGRAFILSASRIQSRLGQGGKQSTPVLGFLL